MNRAFMRHMLAGVCMSVAGSAAAQSYPDRPIRFIVPFAPGGTNDIVARMIGVKLTEAWGQPVVIDNRGGAGGVIGADLVAKSASDGYTLLMANVNFATNPGLVPKLPYDTAKDFAAVSLLATSPSVLVVHPSLPVRSVKELITLAKSKPGQLVYSTSGAGSTGHMAMELLKQLAGIDMVAVHYKGGGPATVATLSGETQLYFVNAIPEALPHIQAKRLKALGITDTRRNSSAPQIPTMAEAGLPGYEFVTWQILAAPKATPDEGPAEPPR